MLLQPPYVSNQAVICSRLNRFVTLPHPLNSPSIVNCQGSGVAACYGTGTNEVNQFDAANLCGKVGARLCTATELKEDDSHGSGCNYDYHWVWSSTPCMYHRLHSRQDCTCTIHQIVCDACYAFVTPCYVYLGPHPAFIPLLSPTSAPIRPPQTRITHSFSPPLPTKANVPAAPLAVSKCTLASQVPHPAESRNVSVH